VFERLAYLRKRLFTGIWFIPIALCAASFMLGVLMLGFDRHMTSLFSGMRMFALPVDSARQVLSVIAGSVISVGGVSLSVTMVALTLTSGQYGPEVLRHFLEDNDSRVSLGLFLGAYVYALVVMTGYIDTDRPHLTVLTGLLCALIAVMGFIRFIHRTATHLQADEIVERIGKSLEDALQHLIGYAADDARTHDVARWRQMARGHEPALVAQSGRGYVQTIDYAGLIDWCVENDCYMQVRIRAGDFVIGGIGAFKVFGCRPDVLDASIEELERRIITGPVRTSIQDPEYPITQLNQVAARALSPGINDPGTAISCVDAFSLALAGVVDREFPGSVVLDDDGRARLLVRFIGFEGILKSVFAQLRQFANADVALTVSLFKALCRLAELTTRPERLGLLATHGNLIWDGLDDQGFTDYDLRDIRQRYKRLQILVSRFC
jgi:uncharacterized membrane protein